MQEFMSPPSEKRNTSSEITERRFTDGLYFISIEAIQYFERHYTSPTISRVCLVKILLVSVAGEFVLPSIITARPWATLFSEHNCKIDTSNELSRRSCHLLSPLLASHVYRTQFIES